MRRITVVVAAALLGTIAFTGPASAGTEICFGTGEFTNYFVHLGGCARF